MDIYWLEILILLASAFVCVVAYIEWIFNYWKRQNVPYIKPKIPMGNVEPPWAFKKGIHQTMADIYCEFMDKGHKHGGIFAAFRPVYMPVDLEILKSIMIKDFQHFVDRGVYYNEVTDPLSAHLFSLEGEKWKSLRARLSPTFTSGKMKAMFQLVLACGNELEKEVTKMWKNKQPANIKEVGALFTTNVIGSCAFGLDCNCFAEPDNDIRYHSKKILEFDVYRILVNVMTISFPKLCRKLGVKVFPEENTKFYSDVVRKIMNHRELNNERRNDFLQLLLDMKNSGTANTFTFEEIAAQSFVFFLAGFETSSSTMTFAFYEMAKNQEIQDKVREEVRHVLKQHDGKITYEAILQMTYMTQVFDETLRKYPILATLERVCTKDYKVPGEDLILKKGQKLMISLQGIHNHPNHYPDPERFDPERFTPENKAKRHPCAYMPFGEGPRICIGMRFGIMQAKVGMAIMLKDYKYTINPNLIDLKLNCKSPLLAPIGDVLLNIEKAD